MSHSERYKDTGRTSVFYDGAQYGIQQERERIIKIVERLDISFSAEEGHNFIVGDALDLIDLIKGEQK